MCNNEDEPQKYYAKGKKMDTKIHILYDPMYLKFLERPGCKDRMQVHLKGLGQEQRLTANRTREFSRVRKCFKVGCGDSCTAIQIY